MNKIREVKYLVVHCSATPPHLDWGVEDIRRLHQGKAFQWKDVGYHYVIKRDGTVEKGRSDQEMGAHVRGYNEVSLGVCLIGGTNAKAQAEHNYTDQQMDSLERVLGQLSLAHPKAVICGHRDLDDKKECPVFSAKDFCAERLIGHNWPATGLKIK